VFVHFSHISASHSAPDRNPIRHSIEPTTISGPTDNPPNHILGIFLAAVSAIGLGCAVALAKMAYEGGTDALSIASVRAIGVSALLAAILVANRKSLLIRARYKWHVLGLGVLLAFMFYGNIAAVQYIPVGMAALLLFINPPVVAIIMVAGFGARFSGLKALTILGAFAGLGLTLGVSLSGLRWEGVTLATTTGLAVAVNAVWISQWLRHLDSVLLTFHICWVSAVVLWGIMLATGGPTLPVTSQGWTGAIAVVALQVCCLPMYFASLKHAGAESATMVTNVQPVASVVAAFLLYAELLTSWQTVGGVMVIGCIVLMQWEEKRARSIR